MIRNLLVAALAAFGLAAPAQAADRCDRACLEGFVDRYIAAMVAHDPGRLPWAPRPLSTENGQAIGVGDGLWGTASAVGAYRLYAADAEEGQVGFLGTIYEGGKPVLLALRLKVEDQVIAEAEMLVARPTPGSFFADAGKKLDAAKVRPQFLRTVPEAERMSRPDLVRVANSYFTGLTANSGRNTAPFAPTCLRWENANQTTDAPRSPPPPSGVDILAMGCEAQQKSGFFSFVTSIRNRRFPIVDRERGLVMAFGFFDHQGRIQEITLNDGRKVPSPLRSPLTFQIAELFQIDKGRIDQIEAILDTVPYGMVSDVWDRRAP